MSLENNNKQLKQCRICWDNDKPDDLISPCLCNGGSAYVHRKCLNDWRSENLHGRSFKFCDVCRFEYVIETVLTDSKTELIRLLKYHCFVILDSIIIIVLVQSIILALAFLLRIIDRKNENIKNSFPNSIHEFTVYYISAFALLLTISSLVVFFVLLLTKRNDTDIDSNNNTNSFRINGINKKRLLIGMITNVLICAVIGLFFGIIISIIALRKIMKHHANQLWLRQEAEKYVIKDFQNKRKELESLNLS